MKKIPKMIIIIAPTALFAVYFPIFLVGLGFHGGSSQDWPSECGSNVDIVYNDPAKHNATKIRQAIENKAPEMIERFHGAHDNWWDYVSVNKPDENDIASIGVPGIFMSQHNNPNYDLLVESLMDLEGISEIIPRGAWCN